MHFITVKTVNDILINVIHILIIISILFKITQAGYIILYPIENLRNINCHKQVIEGDFPSADRNKPPPLKSIFFIESSCKGGINSRQACSIESAARAHPKWNVNVLFAGPVSIHTQGASTIAELQKFKNIKFSRIHVTEYGKDTPLEDILKSNILNSSRWSVMHSADVLRYLTLYKWGGVYLDLDVMVIKPFDGLARNWVAKQSKDYIASGLVAVWRNTRGKVLAKALIRHIKDKLNVGSFDSLGPTTMMEVLGDLCTTRDVTKLTTATCPGTSPHRVVNGTRLGIPSKLLGKILRLENPSDVTLPAREKMREGDYVKEAFMSNDSVCTRAVVTLGIAVYGSKYFYPINYPSWHRYFQNEEPDLNDCYTHHMWNYMSRYELISRHSMYAKLAEKFCPSIFNLYNSINNFGF